MLNAYLIRVRCGRKVVDWVQFHPNHQLAEDAAAALFEAEYGRRPTGVQARQLSEAEAEQLKAGVNPKW